MGKLLGPAGWTKGGLGLATERLGEATVAALAVVNAFGEVVAEDGAVLAGAWEDGAYKRTVELLQAGRRPRRFGVREATTLVCVMTDARLTKTQAWLVARASSAGVARAVDPAATAVDGDIAVCLATGAVETEPIGLSALAARVVAAAIRDGVREATSAPGCPALRDREAG